MGLGRSLKRYCFERLPDFLGVAAFFRLRKKSRRFGIGISCPFAVFCVRGFTIYYLHEAMRLLHGYDYIR